MNYTPFAEKKFTIRLLAGISEKTIEEHLKLYAGYVKHANLILQKIAELSASPEEATANAYLIGELRRRFGFEFGGIKNHEAYFEQFEGDASPLDTNSPLHKKIAEQWGSYDTWLAEFKLLAMTRGIGWAFLFYDTTTDTLLNSWVGEQHDGHLPGLVPVLGLDMWEHSYMLDVPPSEKKKYVDSFFANINMEVVSKRFK
jgi:Fe-Mn family superoxide dismutase